MGEHLVLFHGQLQVFVGFKLLGLDHGAMTVITIMTVIGCELKDATIRLEIDEHGPALIEVAQLVGDETITHGFDQKQGRTDELIQIVLGHKEPSVFTALPTFGNAHANHLFVGGDLEAFHGPVGVPKLRLKTGFLDGIDNLAHGVPFADGI